VGFAGQEKGITVAGLAFGTAARPVTSCCTIGISTAEELPGKVEELRHHPVIKVKSDQRADLNRCVTSGRRPPRS